MVSWNSTTKPTLWDWTFQIKREISDSGLVCSDFLNFFNDCVCLHSSWRDKLSETLDPILSALLVYNTPLISNEIMALSTIFLFSFFHGHHFSIQQMHPHNIINMCLRNCQNENHQDQSTNLEINFSSNFNAGKCMYAVLLFKFLSNAGVGTIPSCTPTPTALLLLQ